MTTQCEQKRQRRHPVPPHGIRAGGLNPQQHHHGTTANGGNGSGEYALFWRTRGDPAHSHRQGVTPCKSSATAKAAAKGDLCIRSNSPSWLAVQAHAEAAKGDLCSRSDSPSWLSVCTIFLCPSVRHTNRGIPQDRDCLTAASTGGVETSRNLAYFCDSLAQERALFRSSETCVRRIGEKARSPLLR